MLFQYSFCKPKGLHNLSAAESIPHVQNQHKYLSTTFTASQTTFSKTLLSEKGKLCIFCNLK